MEPLLQKFSYSGLIVDLVQVVSEFVPSKVDAAVIEKLRYEVLARDRDNFRDRDSVPTLETHNRVNRSPIGWSRVIDVRST
jgi:hypothetical protein